MKRLITIAVLLIGVSVSTNAQDYRHADNRYNNQLPHYVVKKAHRINRKNDFIWVGTQTIIKGHRSLFVITMKKGNRFADYTLNGHGNVISKRIYYKHRPKGRSGRYARSSGNGHGYGYGYENRNNPRSVTHEYWSPGITYNRWH